MTRVIVSSKTSLNILQDGQIKDVILSQPSIIQLGINQESIKSIIKQGDDLVITLKNGEKIIIRDFYNEMNASEHTLALSNDDGSYSIAEFDDSGKFVRYTSSSQAVPQVSTELPTQVSSVSEPADDLGITKSQLIKGGLIALAAEGLYLLAVNDDDDNNNDKNDSTDMIAPITPTAVLSSDTQTITGKTEAKAKIEIKDSTGKVIATGLADQDGNYTVKLNEPLVNGSKVAVSAIDSAGNVSKSTVVTGTKDTIAPDSPLAQLNQDGTIVTGKAEANAKIEVKSADGQTTIGSGTVGADGKFSLSLSPALTDKNIAKIYIIDSSGNRSEPTDVFGAKDTIAPTKPLLQTVMDDIGGGSGNLNNTYK